MQNKVIEKNLRVLNGECIRKRSGVLVVHLKMLYSDGRGHMVGGAMIKDKEVCADTVFQVNLTEEEMKKSSTFRELRWIKEGLKALKARIFRGIMKWHRDNWAACKIVEFDSMKKDCHRVAVRINQLIQKQEMNFEIVWHSRGTEEISFADKVSKYFD